MGKEVVLVNEAPGFVTSRINALIGNEAFRMLQEGVASAEDIDKALKLGLNHPMGPFEMVDLVGPRRAAVDPGVPPRARWARPSGPNTILRPARPRRPPGPQGRPRASTTYDENGERKKS